MKLHTDSTTALNTVTAYGEGYIEVNLARFSHAVAFGPEGDITEWPVRTPADISSVRLQEAARLVAGKRDPLAFLDEPETPALQRSADTPEVLIVGTGLKQRLLPQEVLRPLLMAGVGVEVMDTQAAARTYNILMAEGRRVVVALLPTDGDSPA
ncbi:Mth938-like domain-containing protein [Bordetella avium]|uniref:Uncharacterized protein n=1 Tax=Bordetella avium (strain 197N) TaxID=360910 RepID=Q2KZ35_BORA1|nr:MTH938/NDUFAF3 family protein [Bordetella avium]AZY49475.1 hypothetical protein C0J09_10220 [Bordetella avium]AZY52872.1 hypothetical protein C0J07_10445 [Bordetella avium]RIQ11748.1 hypothetical protein D0432_15955 [Bordetella avium]RIQ16171.1 hypothetical protein D0850_16205 [Bordetella avium]RIQ30324.1 hypothetical protein D0849_15925 [Bordetella avium]